MIEKRAIPRFKVPIKLEYQRPDKKEKYSSLTLDISMKGLRLQAQEVLRKDEILDLFFYFPNKPPQEAVGKVLWSENFSTYFQAGLCFLSIKDSLKEDIFEYILKYFPQEIQKQWWGS